MKILGEKSLSSKVIVGLKGLFTIISIVDLLVIETIVKVIMSIITIFETRFRHICIIVYNTNNMDNNKIIKRKYKKQKSIININSDYSIIKYIFYI